MKFLVAWADGVDGYAEIWALYVLSGELAVFQGKEVFGDGGGV